MTYSTKKSKIYVLTLAFLFSFSLLTMGMLGVPEDGLALIDQNQDAGYLYQGNSATVQVITLEDQDSNSEDVLITQAVVDNLGTVAPENIDSIELLKGDEVKGSNTVSSWPVGIDISDFTVSDDGTVTAKLRVHVSDSATSSGTLKLVTTLKHDEGSNTGIQRSAEDGVEESLVPITDSADEIATYSDGFFYIDMNGSLDWTPGVDRVVRWGKGQALVGDFNPDEPGDEIATYSDGFFYIDMDGSFNWTSDDRVVRWGKGQALVGDFNPDSNSNNATDLSWKGKGEAKGLSVNKVLTYPNPVSSTEKVTFSVKGKGIEAMKVDIYTASGSMVYSSGYEETRSISWDLNSDGGSLANGIYLYRVAVKGRDATLASDAQTLLVLK